MTSLSETTVFTPEDRALVNFTLDQLELSPLNPRKSVRSEDIEALASSIRSVGLLQNLAGLKTKKGIKIVAGGRRLRALQQIANEDKRPEMSVPVILAENELEAQAWASSENIARAALHPVDEIRAYHKMADTGCTLETIAKAFAVTLRHVKGRLRLAVLPEPVLNALGADEITLDAAAAYTVTEDTEAQLRILEESKKAYRPYGASDIRRRLMADTGDAASQLALFVGREAYEAAGGSVREDLFGADVYFLDQELLARLAAEKLEAEAERIEGEGWKWTETSYNRMDYQRLDKMSRATPKKTKAGKEQFTAKQKTQSGVYIWLNHRGETEQEHGLIHPQDRKAAIEAGVCKAPQSTRSTTEKKGPYSAALSTDLARIRTGAIQTALLAKPELALALLTFALMGEVYSEAMPLGIGTRQGVQFLGEDSDIKLSESLITGSYSQPKGRKEAATAFAAFQSKPKKERTRLLVEKVARIFTAELAGQGENPLVEAVADLAAADVRAVWTPGKTFFSRLTSNQLDAIKAEIDGKAAPAAFLKLKKRDKVAHLDVLFNDPTASLRLPAQTKTRLAAWLPEGMEHQAQGKGDGGSSSPTEA